MKKLLFFLALASQLTLFAQRNCSTMEVLNMLQKEDPFLNEKMDQIETFTQNFIQNQTEVVTGVITIPVVFHVVYNRRNSNENISLSQIQSQIAVLNQDFRRLNADANNTWSQADDIEIEFCLASVDPSGNPTNGVNRKSTKKNSFGTNNSVKFNSQGGINAWPANSYLNVWVCNIGGGILGYAQFPGGSASTDGVVLDYRYVGTNGTATYPFNLGRTATHEVGHWLNLRHIWGDGPCGVDDFVGDTPESDNPNYSCATGHISCSTVDMIENYMDYSDDACMNLFTAGQKVRMRALFEPGGFRASMLNSNGCGSGSTGPTCFDGIQNGDETGVDCGGSICPPCQQTGVCADPTGLSAQSKKGGREATLSWNASTGALSYEVGLRPSGATSYATVTISATSITATGLSRNSSYDWYVIANCSGGATSNQVNASFTARLMDEDYSVSDWSIYPNPASSFVNMTFNAQDAQTSYTITVMDVAGRAVLLTQGDVNTGKNELVLNMGELAAGVYVITMQIGTEVHQQKLILE